MVPSNPDSLGDFVRVATCASPTEAHLLKGVLESAGLSPHVADANIVQANTWMTQAVGGVRVLVPSSQVAAAQSAIAEFNAGAYQLEGDSAPAPSYRTLPSPVFSPDRAVLLSFLLTPVFGAAVQLANTAALGTGRRASQWVWLCLLAASSVLGIAMVHGMSPGPFVAFRASFVMAFITVVWYFIAGQSQSRLLLATYGPKYPKKSVVPPALLTALALLGVGWLLSEYA